ncbi:hypothetical protein P692DRAFT_20465139 [Suillus brevipes Sb2]|nr:hypothetical protein P692DRAFT_20465139 [Suillus brevipes Sb2]
MNGVVDEGCAGHNIDPLACCGLAHCWISPTDQCGSFPFHETGPHWPSHVIAYWAMTRMYFSLCLNCNTWILLLFQKSMPVCR